MSMTFAFRSGRTIAALMAATLLGTGAACAKDLTVGWAETIDTLNPVTTGARNVGPLLANVFDTLVWLNKDFKIEPLLAKSWKVSPDGKAYTFELRDDVKFHDGTPFDAESVVANFAYITDKDTQSKIARGLLGPCLTASATGKYEVTISCTEPYAPLLTQMGEAYLGMQSPAAIKQYGADLGAHPIGTGPFKLQSYAQDQSLVLVKNPDYHWMAPSLQHQGPAAIDKLTFQIVTNPQSRVQQFQSGQSQVMQQVPGLYWKALGASGKYTGYEVPISGMGIFAPINTQLEPTNDIRVRKAILHIIDQKNVIQLAEAGVFPPSYTPLSEGMLGYDPELAKMYPHDLDKAAKLLTEAGYTKGKDGWEKDGKPLTVHLTAISTKAQYMAQAQAIQGYLNQFGFKADLEAMASPAWLAANTAGKSTMTPSQYIGVDPDAMHFWYLKGEYFNWSKFSDDKLTALFNKGRSEVDPEKRKPIYVEIQKIIMENALELPIRQNIDLTMADKSVKGLTWAGGGFQYFGAVTVN
jgi:peptide/nickel transport system substrate-binding protein